VFSHFQVHEKNKVQENVEQSIKTATHKLGQAHLQFAIVES